MWQYEVSAEWKDIPGTSVKGNTQTEWIREFKPVKASRIRLFVTKTKGNVSRIWEIGVFGGE